MGLLSLCRFHGLVVLVQNSDFRFQTIQDSLGAKYWCKNAFGRIGIFIYEDLDLIAKEYNTSFHIQTV